MARGFALGVVVVLVALGIGGYLFVTSGALPAGQDAATSRLETWAAKTSLRATVRRESKTLKSPVTGTDADLAAGVALYREHCQVCHGGPDGVATAVANGLSPHAPQLAKHGVEDDPEGVIYWKIAHGIRFTGMPGFGRSLDERALWEMTLFLKHMDALPPAARAAWLAPKSAS